METKVDLTKKPKCVKFFFSKHWPKSLPRFLMSLNSLLFDSFIIKGHHPTTILSKGTL